MSLELKNTINDLSKIKDDHTGCISLYIPGNKDVNDVISILNDEISQSSNIKDKNNRNNVQKAIKKIIE